jgi:hypothetical protein
MQGASDDILNAKNMLYQHLTWDPDRTISLCSKLALPLATPAVGVTPPVSPKSTSADGEHGVSTKRVPDLVLYGHLCEVDCGVAVSNRQCTLWDVVQSRWFVAMYQQHRWLQCY